MSKVIGIDLGTGNSVVAVVENGEPHVIVNAEGNRTTPSVVGFVDGGERKVGEAAKRQQITNPKNTISLSKRFIGNDFKAMEKYLSKFPYEVIKNESNLPIFKLSTGKTYTPQEISAAVLQKMKKTAEDYVGEEIKDAVITVPAYFNDSQRKATKEAGEIAGVNVLRIINEPTAAALAYGVDKLNKDMKIIVVDSGCGTTDISILEISSGVFEVLSTNGDVFLGGDDIDKLIMDKLIQEIKTISNKDISSDPMALQRIKEAAEKAKIELSTSLTTEINIPYITVNNNDPIHLQFTLTRAMFEEMIKPFVEKTIDLTKEAIKKANVSVDEIDEVLLVGGTSRIPALQSALKTIFKKDPNKSINPDEAVAIGAAIQGSVLSGEQTGILLLDVTPLNLNITTMGGIATTVIEANTTIPVTKSEVFSTAVDNQPSVEIEITQGNRSQAKDNKKLGTFILSDILPAKRGVPQIEVSININANGIMEVTATDKGTGKSQNIRIEGSTGLSKDEISKMKADAEAHADEDKKIVELQEFYNKVESTIYMTEKSVNEDLKDKISDEDKTAVNDALLNLKTLYNVKPEEREKEKIETALEDLNKKWYEISAKLYQQTQDASVNASNTTESNESVDEVEPEEVINVE